MNGLVFDIETNGLLPDLTRIHCIALRGLEDSPQTPTQLFGPDEIMDALDVMSKADRLVGHNIMAFDLPAIRKVFPKWKTNAEIIDTLVLSRMAFLNMKEMDFIAVPRGQYTLPGKLVGKHSLEAWGHRLGYHKGDYASEMRERGLDPWAEYNEEMGEYCVNDVDLNTYLFHYIRKRKLPRNAVNMEHRLWSILLQQMERGCYFDQPTAADLYGELSSQRQEIEEGLRERFGWWWKADEEKTPKRDNKRYGYIEGCPFTKVKRVDFNPASRDHIVRVLKDTRGWKPKVFTDKGNPKVDESVLSDLPWPEAEALNEYLMIEKRIGQLAEGKNAWLKLVEDDSRIYGQINPNGTVTGRAAHFYPNLGQVPRIGNPYGKECRQLFTATPGLVMVGADLSSLELRMLAHYMAFWDDGEYAHEVVEGDVHTKNQHAAGLPTRDLAKTFFYALIYGAGDKKIGKIIGKGPKAGKKLKETFFAGMPAAENLLKAVQKKAKKNGYLKTLNGVRIPVRSQHSALNTLLQSAGSVITKQSIVNFHELASKRGYTLGRDYHQVLWVHDEIQIETKEVMAEELGQLIVDAFRMTTEQFNLNCPMDGEYQVGPSWAETH